MTMANEVTGKVHKSGRVEVNEVPPDAVWRWLEKGWKDMMRAPVLSIGYGLVFVLIGAAIVLGMRALGFEAAIPASFAAFTLIAPIMAVGLYEISRRLEEGEPLKLQKILFVDTASPSQIALVGFFLMFGVLVWIRVATLLYALFSYGDYGPLSEFISFVLTEPAGLTMLVVGTLMGGAIAFAIFSISALSFPMMMDRDVDAFTAIMTSINAVIRQPATMLLWAWLIAIIVAAGVATLFVGLALAFPLLGHATWHAYKDLVPE